jgi:hypothetical protein
MQRSLLALALTLLLCGHGGCSSSPKLDRQDGAPPSDLNTKKDINTDVDLEVLWTIDSATNTVDCVKHGINRWRVEIKGAEILAYEQPCTQSPWSSGAFFNNIKPGIYSIGMIALDKSGKALASVERSNTNVASKLTQITFDLKDADFKPAAGQTLNVYWNINGTEDGTPKGQSWDTCDEVGAAKAIVLVNGKENAFHCKGSGYPGVETMSAAVSVSGKPTVQVKLVDASGAAITTMTPSSPGPSSAGADTWEYVGEFYWDAFSASKSGDYWFTTTYESKTCAQLTPPVQHQVTLLTLSGSAVTADVCGPSSVCVKTNGADLGKCYTSSQTQKIKSVTWGDYKVKLSGATGSAPGTICWEKTFDILVGAGVTNPTRKHDVPRISSTGVCMP